MSVIEVTRVSIYLPLTRKNPRLLAFADVVLGDAIVIRDTRIIRSNVGRLVVQMPNRPHRFSCPHCSLLTQQIARCCCHCGRRLPESKEPPVYHDVVHPAHNAQRDAIERAVLVAYAELDAPPLRVVSA